MPTLAELQTELAARGYTFRHKNSVVGGGAIVQVLGEFRRTDGDEVFTAIVGSIRPEYHVTASKARNVCRRLRLDPDGVTCIPPSGPIDLSAVN